MSDSEEDWAPPTEAQMKVIQAKRERSDKISKLMGDYLLKGYKMLATSCPVCLTVELQDRTGTKFCVACTEVDCHETSKDDPALSSQAAERVVEEEAFISRSNADTGTHSAHSTPVTSHPVSLTPVSTHSSLPSLSSLAPLPTHPAPAPAPQISLLTQGAGARPRVGAAAANVPVKLPETEENERDLLTRSLRAVTTTLEQATRELEAGDRDTERRTQTVILVREAANTLLTLKQLISQCSSPN